MSGHQENCPCVRCNPIPCPDCGMASVGGRHLGFDGRCIHRRACEARQMLNVGAGVDAAAAHAQGFTQQAGKD